MQTQLRPLLSLLSISTGHILRLLATHHITREVCPDVFANNRLSSFMDSGKDVKDLYIGTEYAYVLTHRAALLFMFALVPKASTKAQMA